MKKFILFFVLVFACITVKAQSGYNYYEWGVGGGVGYGKAYADTKRQDYHPIYNLNIAYNYSPYLPIALELQFGTLSGGGRTRDKDASGRIYKNAYKALIFHADQQMGDFFDYSGSGFLNVIKNFYIGTGIGAVSNNMKDIQRTNLYAENGAIGSIEGFQGRIKVLIYLYPSDLVTSLKFLTIMTRWVILLLLDTSIITLLAKGLTDIMTTLKNLKITHPTNMPTLL